jgi:hypothetical protein
MNSKNLFFKSYDAVRLSPFLRLFSPFLITLVASLLSASLLTSCEKATLTTDDGEGTEPVETAEGKRE